MLRALSLVALFVAVGASSTAAAQSAESCSVMVDVDGKMRTEPVSGYVITGAATPLRLPDGYTKVTALICDRAALALGDNDYRVLIDLEIPLYVHSGGRLFVVEIVSGRLQIRFVQGVFTQNEETDIQSALNRAQSLMQGASQ